MKIDTELKHEEITQ